MYIRERERVLELLDTIDEAVKYCMDNVKNEDLMKHIGECVMALEYITKFLKEKAPKYDVTYIEKSITTLCKLENNEEKEYLNILGNVKNDLEIIRNSIMKNIEVRWKALFLPYKAAMWTSLESIWKSARSDPNCDATVVCVPYFDISNPENINIKYEAMDFPKDVPITSFNSYKIEEQEPEMIFIHNPYDEHNNLTRVPEEYYSFNLKKYTKCLVYSPYFTMSRYKKGVADFQYAMPGIYNMDKIVAQSKRVKDIFMTYNHPESRILEAGSPKVEAVINKMKKDMEIPKEWKDKLKDKKVFLLNTHLSYFPTSSRNTDKNGDYAVKYHKQILNAILNRKDCALIWRPHPLLKSMIESRFRECCDFVNYMEEAIEQSSNGVIDRTGDYSIAFRCSDALISTYSSLINEYMVTGKPVMIFQKKPLDEYAEKAPIDYRVNYFRFLPYGMKFEDFIDMVIKGEDPKYEERMKEVNKAFLNINEPVGDIIYKKVLDEINK